MRRQRIFFYFMESNPSYRKELKNFASWQHGFNKYMTSKESTLLCTYQLCFSWPTIFNLLIDSELKMTVFLILFCLLGSSQQNQWLIFKEILVCIFWVTLPWISFSVYLIFPFFLFLLSVSVPLQCIFFINYFKSLWKKLSINIYILLQCFFFIDISHNLWIVIHFSFKQII